MEVRADLLAVLIEQVKSWEVSQEAATERLSITHPRLNDFMRDKLGKFSLDALVDLAATVGLTLEIGIGTGLHDVSATRSSVPKPISS